MRPARENAGISIRAHAIFDYALPLGIALMATSRRFGRPARVIMSVGPVWHLGYTLLTRYQGGGTALPGLSRTRLPQIGMKAHLACDAAGAVSFLAAGLLLRRERASQRLLLAALGVGELAVIALTDRTPRAGGIGSTPVSLPSAAAGAGGR